VDDKRLRVLASGGLAVGAVLGMAGTFAPSASVRSVAWGIDGVALVMASALLTVWFFRKGHYLVASGFLVFMAGQSLVLSSAAMELAAGAPLFGAGTSLWALALALISAPSTFPLVVRGLGLVAAALFAATALQIFIGAPVTALTSPLPFHAYPVLVATMLGWIWTLLKAGRVAVRDTGASAA
jgi:hypothetical protein